jgi:Pvc16 N-terminal domain
MNIKEILEKLAALIQQEVGVELDITNIAALNDGDDFLDSKFPIVLSIVNIEEDKTLRNQTVYLKEMNDHTDIQRHRHPTKHLIMSLLFSSYSKDLEKYLDGIDKLKSVLYFFQQHNAVYYKETKDFVTYDNYSPLNAAEHLVQDGFTKITFETISLAMDQLNQMWSYLGSRYMPSVLVKMKLVLVQSEDTKGEKVIQSVRLKLWENNSADSVGFIEQLDYEPPI